VNYGQLTEAEVRKFVEDGRAVVATVYAGKQFAFLLPDQIYSWIPEWNKDKRCWVDPAQPHAILLMVNGNAGPQMEHEQFHPFLNSYGEGFGKDGQGCVFWKSLLPQYNMVEIKAVAKDTYHDWMKVARPKLMPRRSSTASSPVSYKDSFHSAQLRYVPPPMRDRLRTWKGKASMDIGRW
jgi:hypothetical protein